MIPEKNRLSENQTTLKPGQIKFHNNYLPKLPSGKYAVEVTQTIKGDGLEQKAFRRTQEFEVAGPRFTLPEGDVHSVYPPANAVDNFRGVLPQVVFRKRTLPWERSIDSKVESANLKLEIPYIALLVFEPHELKVDKKDAKNITSTKAVARPTAKMKKPGSGFLPPLLEDGVGDEENCYTIDISISDFKAIVPKTEDLIQLAHVREVNTDDKEFLGMHADGWFSVMLSNRLPKTPREVEAGSVEELAGIKHERNIVHLVSLEGFLPYLEKNPHSNLSNNKYKKVRLTSLASWDFYCTPPEASFTKLMETLHVDMLKLENTDAIKSPYLKTAMEGGYFPLQYHIRNGEKTMAWYRGPLLPTINEYSPEVKDEDVFFSVEGSMVYDDKKGLFDLSYATAWQIGRLLALSDTHFSQSLLDWKKLVNRRIDELLKRKELIENQSVDTTSIADEESTFETLELQKIQKLMSHDFVTDLLNDNLLARLDIAEYFYDKLNFDGDHVDLELKTFAGFVEKEDFKKRLEEGKNPQTALIESIFEE